MCNWIYKIIFLLLIGCTGKVQSSNPEKSESQHNLIEKEIAKPSFDDYPVENISCTVDGSILDKIYTKNKSLFESFYYDREGLEDYCKIFAGKYMAIEISQGSETVQTYIFDCATGEMFESPLFLYSSDYKANSRLYIKDPVLDERQQKECANGMFDYSTKYFLWDEKKKVFEEIE